MDSGREKGREGWVSRGREGGREVGREVFVVPVWGSSFTPWGGSCVDGRQRARESLIMSI